MENLSIGESIGKVQAETIFECANHQRPCTSKYLNCQDHSLCPLCEYQSIEKKLCIYCLRSLTNFELAFKDKIEKICFSCNSQKTTRKLICNCFLCSDCTKVISLADTCPLCSKELKSKKKKYSCIVCTSELISNEMIALNCDHHFCPGCIIFHINSFIHDCERELKKNQGIPCFTCDTLIDIYIIQAVLSPKDFEKYIRILIEANEVSKGKIIRIKQKYPCIVCMSELIRDEMLTLSCDHYFCNTCIEYHIKIYIHDSARELRMNKGIPCFNCNTFIDIYIIQSVLSAEDFEKYNRILIEANECPKCKFPYFTDEQKIICSQCKYFFCDSCFKAATACDCNNEVVITGIDMSACPGCRSLYAKDEGCNHVKCMKQGCREEFCFLCSAVRSPTLEHGNHYHRPQCKYFSDYNGNDDKYSQNCKMCVKAGKLCVPPKNLKILRRINKDEV